MFQRASNSFLANNGLNYVFMFTILYPRNHTRTTEQTNIHGNLEMRYFLITIKKRKLQIINKEIGA